MGAAPGVSLSPVACSARFWAWCLLHGVAMYTEVPLLFVPGAPAALLLVSVHAWLAGFATHGASVVVAVATAGAVAVAVVWS